jgi:hypothetical protein
MGLILCYDQNDDSNVINDNRMELTKRLIYNQWIDIEDYINNAAELCVFIHKKHRLAFKNLFDENKRKLTQRGYTIEEENGDMYFMLDNKFYYSDKHE